VVDLLAVVLLLALVVTAGSITTSTNRECNPVIQAINANRAAEEQDGCAAIQVLASAL